MSGSHFHFEQRIPLSLTRYSSASFSQHASVSRIKLVKPEKAQALEGMLMQVREWT